jgi:hypothetical protein
MELVNGKKETIRPDFNGYIFIDFAGAKITSDATIWWTKGPPIKRST